MKRIPLLISFVLFIGLCMSAAYWGMQLFKPPVRQVAAAAPQMKLDVNLNAAAAMFGGRTAPVAVASNFQLKGVVVAGNQPESVAILSADGKPAQAVRVNVEVVPGVTVKEVHAKYVLLSDGGVIKRVELPEPAKGQLTISTSTPEPEQPPSDPDANPNPMKMSAPSQPPPASLSPNKGGVLGNTELMPK